MVYYLNWVHKLRTKGDVNNMDIKSLRIMKGMSQPEFASFFGIPLGTLRNWEQGVSNPPSYVFTMIENRLRRTEMINIPTMKLISVFNRLSELSKRGIKPFSKATEKNDNGCVFYNDKVEADSIGYPIVLDKMIGAGHHDIISYYDSSAGGEYIIRVSAESIDEGEPFIVVKFYDSNDEAVIVPGHWYFT